MISIKSTDTLLDIEAHCDELATKGANVIRMPSRLRFGGSFAVPVGIVQLLAAWARQSEQRILQTYANDSDGDALFRLAQEPHGLAAAYFAQQIRTAKGVAVSRSETLKRVAPQIQAMQEVRLRDTMIGRGTFLACIAGAKNEFITPFYSRPGIEHLRGRRDFESLTSQLISACAPTLSKHINDVDLDGISLLLYELFRNTNDHAFADAQGRLYNWGYPNIRGTIAKYITVSKDEHLAAISQGDTALWIFLNRSMIGKGVLRSDAAGFRKAQANNFLELTVFDTGPGLARRWLAIRSPERQVEQLTIDEETAVVLKCFSLHSTTKSGLGSGVGLDSVVRSLFRLGAFLRLRTGRVCLWHDFSGGNARQFSPKHWLKERKTLTNCAGASYSILIPLSTDRK